jgi:NADPH2:quinone reductase
VKAVWVEGFGAADHLRLADRPEPVPGPGELLLDVRACGVNFTDLLQRQGLYPGGPRPPFTPGLEAAGVVVARGADVSTPALGTRVIAIAAWGLQAERAVVPAAACRAWPEPLSFEQGAAFPVSHLTAYQALARVAHVTHGELALVHAAAGGLGSATVRVAKRLGLTVVGVASTEPKRALVRAAGADRAAGYDDFTDVVREMSGGRGVDVVVDGVGGPLLARSLGVVAPGGRLVMVGMTGGPPPPIEPSRLLFRSRGILGFHLSSLLERPEALASAAERLLTWVQEGSLEVRAAHCLPLRDVASAHEMLSRRANLGKIVLGP